MNGQCHWDDGVVVVSFHNGTVHTLYTAWCVSGEEEFKSGITPRYLHHIDIDLNEKYSTNN